MARPLAPCFLLASSLLSWSATARAEAPLISYRLSNGSDARQLVFINNPEMLRADVLSCDLADPNILLFRKCARRIFRADGMSGAIRVWWEHRNTTGRAIDYGVRLTNNSSSLVEVRVRGRGMALDSVRNGGKEFVDLFSNPLQESWMLNPGDIAWVARAGTRGISSGDFFAGAVDVDVIGGSVSLESLAFVGGPSDDLEGGTLEQRVSAGVHESLVYKGVASASTAIAGNVNWTIDDATPSGALPVRYPLYRLPQQFDPPQNEAHCVANRTPLCSGDRGAFENEAGERLSWVTHIAPDPNDANPKRALAVMSDAVSLVVPGLPESCTFATLFQADSCFLIAPFFKWFHSDFSAWRFPNWGNWAVHYILSGTIENRGTRPRALEVGVRADGKSPIAFRGDGGNWQQVLLDKPGKDAPNEFFPYSRFSVGPGQSKPYSAELILSGPGAGTLENLMMLSD